VDVLLNLSAPYESIARSSGQRTLDEIAVTVEDRLQVITGASGFAVGGGPERGPEV